MGPAQSTDAADGLSPPAAAGEWDHAFAQIAAPGFVRPVFQPIVDLRRGVVCGYEMLARFAGPPEATPDVWFARAAQAGIAEELEARLIRTGLEARQALPQNCFLTINIGPESLASAPVQAALAHHNRLHGVVIELTEHARVDDDEIARCLPSIRKRGGMIAIDDVGSGYSGLQRIAALRPEFVKVDRALVAGLHEDAAQREVVDSLGAVANRIDAWVIAEGIEETAELEALIGLGVPLGQGFALARPALAMAGPQVGLSGWIRDRAAGGPAGGWRPRHVEPLALDSWAIEARRRFRAEPGVRHLPVVDERGRPAGLIARDRHAAGDQTLAEPLRVLAQEEPAHLARRAMARSPETRFDPVVCCDDVGRYLGLVEIESLIEALAERLDATP